MAIPHISTAPAHIQDASSAAARRWAVIGVVVLMILLRQVASAAASTPFGEVGRFGGYDATGKIAGKFVVPVGFAVDPDNEEPATPDKNAVFVLDQTLNNEATGELQYRLQKLSSAGAVLGSTTLPVEHYTDTSKFKDAHPLISLAVDAAAHRVYAVVENILQDGEGNTVPIVGKVVAWSTEQNPQGELVRASPGEYTEDPLTHASLVAKEATLQHATLEEDLFAPEAIAVDPANHDIVIEAQEGEKEGSTPVGGPTILQRVATEGGSSGQLDGNWVAGEAVAPEREQGDGLFVANGGSSFGVDLYDEDGLLSHLFAVKPNFGTPEVSPLVPATPGGLENRDEAVAIDGQDTSNYRTSPSNGGSSATDLEVFTAGSPIAQLSGGLYAALYGHGAHESVDTQAAVEPWNGGGEVFDFWTQSLAAMNTRANEGIRLFEADGKIVTTIGGQPTGQPCDIDTQQVSLAAGAGNALFVLTQPNAANGDSDDQVIEFAEGGKNACPQPSGQVTVDGQEGPSVTVHQNVPVEFDAITINRAGETPYEFDWNVGVKGVATQTSKIEAPSYTWPSPTTEYTYTKAGTYNASVQLTGDYGTSTFPVEVKVLPSAPAAAEFAFQPSSVTAGQKVVFNAVASKGTPGSNIADYHWSFGDGTAEDTQTPEVEHSYAAAGSYEVTLTITDEVKEEASKTETVVVAPATSVGGGGGNNGGGGSTPVGQTNVGQQSPIQTPPAKTSTVAPTRAQKLAKALKACKHKPKRQRAGCERQAKKLYGPPSHKKKTRKKK